MQRARGASLTSDANNTQTTGRRRIGVLVIVAALVAGLDQVTKVIAVEALGDGRVISIIGDVLQLRLVRNPGAAFGIGTNLTVFLAVVMIAVIIVILRMSRRLANLPWAIGLGGLLGGAIGNFSDRLLREPGPLRGHVIDFLELPHWPVFNVADSAIVGGAAVIAFLSLRGIAHDGSHRERPGQAGPGVDGEASSGDDQE
jgi:signal peptidase II